MHVLERLEAGEPRGRRGGGRIADPEALSDLIEDAIAWFEPSHPDEEDTLASSQPRITLLTPRTPAHDILEDLLDENGCHLPDSSYSDNDNEYDVDGDLDEAEIEGLNERLDAQFANAVRTEAAANQNGLT
ncbi:hypothetical protein [Amycolatopsis dendrobii]|uniref:Uncharacterized protein n=1 Tax=Amycolatopsis dendrobii TaxID=2760662 RepID=A0A7W3W4H4_9PSEU|nr:hypothetical protein [Amycolatopsis dendrobii]MBB1158661.1 hypothetical protein [Amycolatopsis dendrobii]